MGTRSIIRFKEIDDDRENVVATIYQQFDGYLEGVGQKLANWLSNKIIINGIGTDQQNKNYANGIGCLAAQYIADNKNRVGYLYLYDKDNCANQDYNYDVSADLNKCIDAPSGGWEADDIIQITVSNFDHEPFFTGPPSELIAYIDKIKSEEQDCYESN